MGVAQPIPLQVMAKFMCLKDFENEAGQKLDRNAWNYYSSGAMRQNTLEDNSQAYNRCSNREEAE